MCIAIKFVKTGQQTLKERLHVKAFKNANDLGVFLCKQADNSWNRPHDEGRYPTKTGVYAFAGGQYHNVKNLDPSILAHI